MKIRRCFRSGSVILLTIAVISCGKKATELAVIETDFGQIVIRFFEDSAPKHVESFEILAGEGYFNGTTFHRVVPGFVIQGGDPNSKDSFRSNDGTGGRAGKFYGIGDKEDPTTWRLPAEFNDRKHKRGAVSMARDMDPNSAGSQFFICVDDVFRLDHNYTVFGEVVKGIEVVDKIVDVDTPKKLNPDYLLPDGDNPIKPVRMKVWLTTDKELGIDVSEE